MFKTLKIAAASVVLAVGIAATPVLADPINGSITIVGTPSNLPTLPSVSIVSALLGLDHTGGAGIVLGVGGDFTTIPVLSLASMTDWVFALPNVPSLISVGGFTFDLTGANVPVGSPPFTCGPGSCADGLTIALSGVVSAAGYDDTNFTGSLLLSGSCVSSTAGVCTSTIISSYTYSISASGRTVPEPGTLGLLAIALLGLGVMRRKMG